MTALASGTLVGLHGAVKRRLGAVVAGMDGLATRSGSTRAPTVLDGWLPPKDPSRDDFPFLIVRPKSGTDGMQSPDQEAIAVFEIWAGVYRDTDDGWLDALGIVDEIRKSLWEEPVLDGLLEHLGELKWELPEEQGRPQWAALITTTFRLVRPVRVEALAPNPSEGFA